jgi:diguanylate cyclase (GGDEF)-like protein/putative nucleotidyltransferase with HDIG domain
VFAAGLGAYVVVSAGAGSASLARIFETWVYGALLLAAAAVIAARGAVAKPAARPRWLLLAAAPAMWVAADVVWELVYADQDAPPYPSAADGLWLASYALAAAGIAGLIASRLPTRSVALWLDTAIGVCAIGAAVAGLWLGPVLALPGESLAQQVFDVAFPLGDLVLVALAVTIVALTGWRPSVWWLAVAGALAVQGIADAATARALALGADPPPAWLSAAWPAAWLLVAYAAWRPLPAVRRPPAPSAASMAAPVALAGVALALVLTSRITGVNALAAGLAALGTALAIVRLAVSLLQNARLVRRLREDALTDALTRLRNRRALTEDLESATAAGDHLTLAIFDLDGFKRYNDRFGHPAGDQLLVRLARKLGEAIGDAATGYRLGGDEFCVLVDADDAAVLVAAAGQALTERGEGFSVTCSHGAVDLRADVADATEALVLADRRLFAAKERHPTSAHRQSRDLLLEVLARREPDVHEHSEGVEALARRVAERLELRPEQLDDVARAAELHDIGKMAIPDAILFKPGPLDDEEWRFMQRHTVIGEEILSVAPALKRVAALVRSHHERWDGTGYPDGFAGESIPLGARIVAVCDAYSAMVQDRPYKAGRLPHEALEEIQHCAGRHFDPQVVQAFTAEMAEAGVLG